MEERIDHVAEARLTLDQTLSYGGYGEDAGAVVSMLAAQTHATLALAEQQRIANLIAVAKWNAQALAFGARKVGDEPFDDAEEIARTDAIFAEVHDALGLS